MSDVCSTCNATHAPYTICGLPRSVCTRGEGQLNGDEPFRTGNGVGGALLKHRDHPIHTVWTVRVMIVLRLNDLRCGYVCLHTHTLIQREKGCQNEGGSTPGGIHDL